MEYIADLDSLTVALPDGTAWMRAVFPTANNVYGSHPILHLITRLAECYIKGEPPREAILHHTNSQRTKIGPAAYWIDVFFGLTWNDAVGWMLTLACFQRSPWLPFRDHTVPSEVVWPFCLRKAFSVPAWGREAVIHVNVSEHTQNHEYNKCLSLIGVKLVTDGWTNLHSLNTGNWEKPCTAQPGTS